MLLTLAVLLMHPDSKDVPDAALKGLNYLARHQSPDGSWGVPPTKCDCRPEESSTRPDLKITSLSLLAFVSSGYHMNSKEMYEGISFGDVIQRGFNWLTARMRPNGSFHSEDLEAELLGTLAFAQVSWLSGKTQYGEEAEKAVGRVAHLSLTYPPATRWKSVIMQVAKNWDTENCAEHPELSYGLDCPRARRSQKIAEKAMAKAWQGAGSKEPRVPFRPPELSQENAHDSFLSTLRYRWLVGAKSAEWKQWSPSIKKHVLSQQHTKADSCARGSWKAPGFRQRLELTGFHILTIQMYYQYVACLANVPH